MNDIKGYDLLVKLTNNNKEFKKIFETGFKEGKIRFFANEEWQKIKEQNYISPINEIEDFYDKFVKGYNIGDCVNSSIQLSYSYNDVDIVSGTVKYLIGTTNAEKEGGHCWLENENYIIDTSLCLVIDKDYKNNMGYIEEQRLTQKQLNSSERYQSRKTFTNDKNLRRSK